MREALGWALAGRGTVHELFAVSVPEDLAELAARAGVPVSEVTPRAAAGLSETVTPQGIVAVCDHVDVPLADALGTSPRLVAVLVGVSDPGNAGTVIRVADAVGADAVILAGDAVDPHNGKCVRASTGSLFHVPLARASVADTLAACRSAGLRLVAADGHATDDLATDQNLADPTAWVFGSEAHGLSEQTVSALDHALRVPIYGGAESLNLATAAAVCLYATVWRQREPRTR